MFSRTAIEDQALRVVLEERIRTLWGYRAWYREHRWAEWPLRRRETDIELRALVRLARQARRMSRPLMKARYEQAVAELMAARMPWPECARVRAARTCGRPMTTFADEMNAIAAARRKKRLKGDGQSVEASGWMSFDFTKRATPPKPKEPWVEARSIQSEFHHHDGTSECLETVAGGVNLTKTGDSHEVPELGWVRCTRTGIRMHVHGDRLMAHFSYERPGCAPLP